MTALSAHLLADPQAWEGLVEVTVPKCEQTHVRPSKAFGPQEEILKIHITHWWSPYSMRLTYATISDSCVPVMELPTYTGSACCEHPSICLHIIGLNRPTDDLEMVPPDDPSM
ncbi:unnamed protein product, partial [Rangifer tarandus platyrhynchus]